MINELNLDNFELSLIVIALNLYKEQKGLAKEIYECVDEIIDKINLYERNCLLSSIDRW